MQDEIWKDVVGLEKWFEVSNKGRVRSKDRLVNSRWGNDIKSQLKGKLCHKERFIMDIIVFIFTFQKSTTTEQTLFTGLWRKPLSTTLTICRK